MSPADDQRADRPRASHRRGWRRGRAWALIGGAAVLGVAVGLAVSWLMSPQMVSHLRPGADMREEFPFEVIAIDPRTLVRYDDFDAARVWTADSADGDVCVFVTVPLGWFEHGCSPGGLDPIVDVTIHDSRESAGFLGLPSGSLVRFVLRDDLVEVWVARAHDPRADSP